jgi:hypothetical protein
MVYHLKPSMSPIVLGRQPRTAIEQEMVSEAWVPDAEIMPSPGIARLRFSDKARVDR